jgi:nucleotide-binding universal stress UspA family protein
MYTNLLVPTDGTKLSGKALAQALGLAKALKAKVAVLYATPMYHAEPMAEGGGPIIGHRSKADFERLAARAAQRVLDAAAAKAAAAKVECKTLHVVSDAPWEAIIAQARKQKCDAIVMASHGRGGLAAMLIGSETQRVLTHSKLPVVVVR